MKVLIADKLSDVGINWLKEQDGVEVTVSPGLDDDALIQALQTHDGMIVRSGCKVRANHLEDPGSLKCIARAGVGVDNIDVDIATQKGVIVMNTPGGNTVSTAELALTLMMALSRKIAPAAASLGSGEWNRKAYKGTQIAGKTLGVIGMGRIGRAVASRAVGMEMRVLGFDPFFAGTPDSPVEMVKDLEEICKRCDYITVHVPKSPETLGLIGTEQIELMKDGVRLINAARGGIIDPAALLEGIKSGKVAGAALDVYKSEPPEDPAELELIQQDNVLAVPHLGASTEEAQDQVALDAAQQLVEALSGGEVRNAINAPGFDKALPASVRPYTELAKRMGRILGNITSGAFKRVEVIYRGEIAEANVKPITTYFLTGLFQPFMEIPINVINAPVVAEQRGLEIDEITSRKIKEFANLMEVTVYTDKGKRSVVGTIFGNRFPRIIAIDGYRMEMKPEGDIVIIINEDRPGVVGRYGSLFGEKGINIADMTFSRKKTGLAVVGINLDQPPTEGLMDEVRSIDLVQEAWALTLPPLPEEEEV